MKKEEIVRSLLDFADHMCAVEDDFRNLREKRDDLLSKSLAANSLWKGFLSVLSRLFFVSAGISAWIVFLCKVRGLNAGNMDKAANIVKNIFCPFPMAFLVFFAAACLFAFFGIKERNASIKAEKDYRKIKNEVEKTYSDIQEQYNGYENPPVPIEYSNPYFVLDIVDVIENSEEDISVSEAIGIVKNNI